MKRSYLFSWGLCLLWSLLLLQAIFPPGDDSTDVSPVGIVIWFVGLVVLLWLGARSWRSRRD